MKKTSNRRGPRAPKSNDKDREKSTTTTNENQINDLTVPRSRQGIENQDHNFRGGGIGNPNPNWRATPRSKEKNETGKEHTVTHGILLNQILA